MPMAARGNHRAALHIAGIALLVTISACSTVGVNQQSMLANGDYNNLINSSLQDSTYDTMDIGVLDAVCQAYFETRNYKCFRECSDVLMKKTPQAGIDRTSTTKRKVTSWVVGGWAGGLIDKYMVEHFSYGDVVGPVFSKRAMIHLDFENYQAALDVSEKAVGYLTQEKTEHPELLVEAYGINGLAHALRGDRGNAEKRIASMRALAIENEDFDLLRQTALIRIYIALRDYEKAKNVMTADTSSSFLKFMNKVDVGWKIFSRTLKNIELPNKFMTAKIFFETGDWKTAQGYYDELLNDPQFRDFGAAYIVALFDQGMIAKRNGKLQEAQDLFEKAIESIEIQRATINSEASKIGFVGDKQAVYHHLVKILCEQKKFDRAFEYVERSKSRALVDLLAEKKDFAVREENREEVRTVLAQQNAADTRMLPANMASNGTQTRSIQLEAKEYLQTRVPELASLVTVTSQSITELIDIIPVNEILVEYYYSNDDMYAFIISRSGLKAVKLTSNGLQDDVQKYRELVDAKSKQSDHIAKELYLRLFQPIEQYLDQKNLIIIPHGALHYIPMNALYTGSEYLVDRYSIRIMPSASTIKYLQDIRLNKSGGILAFGNPDLGDPVHDLAFAQNEAQEVAKTRANSKVFLRREATEDALRKHGNDYKYIHFATHGLFHTEEPMKSALFLAPDTQNDGILTVDKLYSIHLNANLVTMSACETGLGKIANGDDLVGLARGFFYAGTSAIVSSLWKVDDMSTSYLMTNFYHFMKETNMRDALRLAQLETKKKYAHPYYWASFQLTGKND